MYPKYAFSPIRQAAAPAYGRLVAWFLVFRSLPGVTRDQYAAAQRAAADASRRHTQAGPKVSYLGGFSSPEPARRSAFSMPNQPPRSTSRPRVPAALLGREDQGFSTRRSA